jgi:hypothetical protein
VAPPTGRGAGGPLKGRWLTVVLLVATLAVLAASVPGAWSDVVRRGGFYIFSDAFLVELPRRLHGPGRLRFLIQPVMAILVGVAAGRAAAGRGRPAPQGGHRGRLLNLMLAGILVDAIAQWLIYGISHPGAALLIGPVLITGPFSLAYAVTRWLPRSKQAPKKV